MGAKKQYRLISGVYGTALAFRLKHVLEKEFCISVVIHEAEYGGGCRLGYINVQGARDSQTRRTQIYHFTYGFACGFEEGASA